jgi:glucose-6-phosphate isomerase
MRLETINMPPFENKKVILDNPAFLDYKPDFAKIKEAWKEFGGYKNILVIGNGGSVTGLIGLLGAFPSKKSVHILSTVDPDYISALRLALRRDETLVIAISKSGETVTQIEALMHFIDYPLLCITGQGSTLEKIAEKVGAKIYEHPAIGGRYTAFTEVNLIPAAILGMNVEELYSGAQRVYAEFHKENIASKLAQIMYQLEQRGLVDVFVPFYSHRLFPFSNLLVQLAHESFGKNGVGQTYFAHEAPESQHHTNQRFFGGRKNIAGMFIVVEHFADDQKTVVPTAMHSINIKDGHLFDLNNIPLSYAMHSEFKGTWDDAKNHLIPSAALYLTSVEPKEIGAFIATLQLFAVYSSLLRDVDPFDQPQVESSKQISWKERLEFRKLGLGN